MVNGSFARLRLFQYISAGEQMGLLSGVSLLFFVLIVSLPDPLSQRNPNNRAERFHLFISLSFLFLGPP